MNFIVKTLPKREAKLLLEILPNYFQHVHQNPGAPGRLPILTRRSRCPAGEPASL